MYVAAAVFIDGSDAVLIRVNRSPNIIPYSRAGNLIMGGA